MKLTDTNTVEHPMSTVRNLGPYQIVDEIGAGAMGTVYRAIHSGLDRYVALKVLRSEMLQDTDSVRRFLREARSSARLEHPHIVSVYDAGEIAGQYYIAMKLLEGLTLQSLVATHGRLAPAQVVRMGIQLAGALDYAHGRDVVHLDVKPANVIVTGRDHATLTDFSIAQALNPGATRSATIAGTPLYMSPEQIQGKELDSRSDIYSLGLMLYEMCVGHPPFQGQFVTVMYAHLHSPVPDMRDPFPQIPEALANVIYRALAKDRSERYQTAGEMVRALERALPVDAVDLKGTMRLGREDIEELLAVGAGPVPTAGTGEPARNERDAAGPAGKQSSSRSVVPIVAIIVALAVTVGFVYAFVLKPGAATKPAVARPNVVPIRPAAAVHVQSARLSTSYAQDPATGQMMVGPRLAAVSMRTVGRQTIFAVAQLALKPTHARALKFTASYTLVDPNYALLATFPARPPVIRLGNDHPSSTFAGGFTLQSSGKPPLGTYRVQLRVNGHVLRTMAFQVTP